MDLALHSWCIRPLPEKTKVQSALVSTLEALAMTNLSIIASEVPVYSVVLEYLLPVAVHLLLFRADLRRILQSIRTLLLVFLLGSGLKVRFCKSGEAYECRMILLCDAHQLDCEVTGDLLDHITSWDVGT